LQNNGYTFPDISKQDLAKVVANHKVRSKKDILSARLDEMLRKGGAENLQKANLVMKELSGYEQTEASTNTTPTAPNTDEKPDTSFAKETKEELLIDFED